MVQFSISSLLPRLQCYMAPSSQTILPNSTLYVDCCIGEPSVSILHVRCLLRPAPFAVNTTTGLFTCQRTVVIECTIQPFLFTSPSHFYRAAQIANQWYVMMFIALMCPSERLIKFLPFFHHQSFLVMTKISRFSDTMSPYLGNGAR